MTQVIVKRSSELSEDELMHAGHKYIKKDMIDGKWRYYYDHHDGDGWSNKTGVKVGKNASGDTEIEAFNTKNSKYYDKYGKTSVKKKGPVTVTKAEDGISYKVTVPNKDKIKKYTKKTVKEAKKHINKGKNKVNKMLKIH